MFHCQHTLSIESTCNILSCTSEQFCHSYDGGQLTDTLCFDSLRIVEKNRNLLRSAEQQCRLDDLLTGMLLHAPDPLGTRYVAIALHVADTKGGVAVVNIAKAWLDYLFIPMLAIPKALKTEPSGSQTPTIQTTLTDIQPTNQSDQQRLRAEVAKRESYHCAITRAFDVDHVDVLKQQGKEIPRSPQNLMQAAHIIPFSPNNFDDDGPKLRDATLTWDMLQSWTQLNIKALSFYSPANAIYMTVNDHLNFEKFRFYLDKDVYPAPPNKYRVQLAQNDYLLSDGQDSTDVQFQTQVESGIQPPDPQLLGVHAAFAKVLNLCGAADYFEQVEMDAERAGALHPDGEMDLELLLMSRLALMAL